MDGSWAITMVAFHADSCQSGKAESVLSPEDPNLFLTLPALGLAFLCFRAGVHDHMYGGPLLASSPLLVATLSLSLSSSVSRRLCKAFDTRTLRSHLSLALAVSLQVESGRSSVELCWVGPYAFLARWHVGCTALTAPA